MNEDNAENNSGFWIGLIAGGLLGAGISYFLSFENKEEAKKKLLQKGRWLLENFEDIGEEIGERGKEIGSKAVERIAEVKQEVEEKVQDLPVIAQEAVENVQKAAEEAVANIVSAVEEKEAEVLAEKPVKAKTVASGKKFFFKRGGPLVKK